MSCKVLVVDDSRLARMAVVKLVRSLYPDWTVLEAANAEEALAILKDRDPHLAMVDFNMPGRDGLELVAELHGRKPSMPIAVISANHQREIVNRTLAMGAAFLPKPLTEHSLKEFLTSAVPRMKAIGSNGTA